MTETGICFRNKPKHGHAQVVIPTLSSFANMHFGPTLHVRSMSSPNSRCNVDKGGNLLCDIARVYYFLKRTCIYNFSYSIFSFEGWTVVPIAPVPGHCLPFAFH